MTKEISNASPEDSAASITAIIKDEAAQLGAECTIEETEEVFGRFTSIYVKKGSNHTAIHISWAFSRNLDKVSGTIGNGSMGYDYELELLVGEPPSLNGLARRPFTWGVYEAGTRRLNNPPLYFLTADALRRHVRERIQPN